MDGRMNRRIDGQIDGLIGLTDGWMDRQMNGWMDGRINGWING